MKKPLTRNLLMPSPPSLHEKYKAFLKERNLSLATCKNVQLPSLNSNARITTTSKDIHISQFSIPNEQTPANIQQPHSDLLPNFKHEDNFMDVLDWELFRRTKPNLTKAIKIFTLPSFQGNQHQLAQNDVNNILQRFKLKVQSQIQTLNIMKEYRKLQEKQNISRHQNPAEIFQEKNSKFILLKERQQSERLPKKQDRNHIPEILVKLVRPKVQGKKCEGTSKFLSTISQKRVNKIFEMEFGKEFDVRPICKVFRE